MSDPLVVLVDEHPMSIHNVNIGMPDEVAGDVSERTREKEIVLVEADAMTSPVVLLKPRLIASAWPSSLSDVQRVRTGSK